MCEIPDHHRADLVGPARDRFHIVQATGAIVHLRQHHHSDLVGKLRHDTLGGRCAQFIALPDKVDELEPYRDRTGNYRCPTGSRGARAASARQPRGPERP